MVVGGVVGKFGNAWLVTALYHKVVKLPQVVLPVNVAEGVQLLSGVIDTVGVILMVVNFNVITADSVSIHEGVPSDLRQRTR